MARKNRYQYDQNQDFDTTERVSRSQKKRESTALQELGASLAKLPLRELERLGISPDLLAAYRELSRITSREAKRRQMQYIGRLMREEDDTERLQEAPSGGSCPFRGRTQALRRLVAWIFPGLLEETAKQEGGVRCRMSDSMPRLFCVFYGKIRT